MVLYYNNFLKLKSRNPLGLPLLNTDLYQIEYHRIIYTYFVVRYPDLKENMILKENIKKWLKIKNKEIDKAKFISLILPYMTCNSIEIEDNIREIDRKYWKRKYINIPYTAKIPIWYTGLLLPWFPGFSFFYDLGALEYTLHNTIKESKKTFSNFLSKIIKSLPPKSEPKHISFLIINHLYRIIDNKHLSTVRNMLPGISRKDILTLKSKRGKEIFWKYFSSYFPKILSLKYLINERTFRLIISNMKMVGITLTTFNHIDLPAPPYSDILRYEYNIYSVGKNFRKHLEELKNEIEPLIKMAPVRELVEKEFNRLIKRLIKGFVTPHSYSTKFYTKEKIIEKLYRNIKHDYEDYYKTFFEDPIVWGTNIEDRGKGILLIDLLIKNYLKFYEDKDIIDLLSWGLTVEDKKEFTKKLKNNIKNVIEHLKRYNLWRNDEIKTVIDIIHGAMDKEKRVIEMFKTLNKEYLIDRPLKYSEQVIEL